MKFTLEIPLGVCAQGEFQTLDAIAEMAAALDRAKADAAFVTDHPAPDTHWLHQGMGHDALDPFAALAFVASASRQLMVHTNIVVAGYRNPFLLAKCAATLQTVSEGRLILGIGGGYQKAEFQALGSAYERRGKLFDEALQVLRLAWSGSSVSFAGMDFNAVEVEPRPSLAKPPPVKLDYLSREGVQQYVDLAGELREAGTNWISAMVPHGSRAEYIDNVEWFGEVIIPAVRG